MLEKSTEQKLLDELRSLCASPGFLYTFIKLILHDAFSKISINPSGTDLIDVLNNTKQSETLNQQELALLLHLLYENKINPDIVPDKSILKRQEQQARSLLDSIHKTYLEGLNDPLFKPFKQESDTFDSRKKYSSSSLQEISFYAEESAYPFQYLSFAKQRYSQDDSWMKERLGFTSKEMHSTIQLLLEGIKYQLARVANLDEIPTPRLLHAFNIDRIFEYEISEQVVEKNGVAAVVNFFTTPQTLHTIQHPWSFNEILAKPIVEINNQRYLFLPKVLCEAAYESPFYFMINDNSYANKASQHRGAFTEQLVYDRLKLILGEDNVYRNVNLWNGKNKSSEIDVLGIVADCAIIFQCKSKGMTQKARQGDSTAAYDDFSKAVGNAFDQNIMCWNDIQNTHIIAKDDDNNTVALSRKYKAIYPLCIVSDQYPSLSIQYLTYLSAGNKKQPKQMPEQIVSDIFFIDIVTELLKTPLLLIDFISKRSQFGHRLISYAEINSLGVYLACGYCGENPTVNYYLGSDLGLEIDAAMVSRRTPLMGEKLTPKGLLQKITDHGYYSNFIKEVQLPRSSDEREFGQELLCFEDKLITQFNSMTNDIITRCTKENPIHTVSFMYEKKTNHGISLIAVNKPYLTNKNIIPILNNVRKNDAARKGNWFIVLFDSLTLHLINLEHQVW